jgi:hypothetical protein
MINLDLDILQNYITNFANTYDLIQQSDIERIETSDKFNKQDYLTIDGKKFIYLFIHEYHIRFGKIEIEKEYFQEEEYYSIEKKNHFKINIMEFSNIVDIMNEVHKKCIINNFID